MLCDPVRHHIPEHLSVSCSKIQIKNKNHSHTWSYHTQIHGKLLNEEDFPAYGSPCGGLTGSWPVSCQTWLIGSCDSGCCLLRICSCGFFLPGHSELEEVRAGRGCNSASPSSRFTLWLWYKLQICVKCMKMHEMPHFSCWEFRGFDCCR